MDNERQNFVSQYFDMEEVLLNANEDILPLLDNLSSGSSTESSSSSDDSDREERSKCANFCEVIENYTEKEFKSHMRLKRSTVEFLIERYAGSLEPRTNSGGRESVPPKKKLFVFIWYVSNTVTFRQLGNLFGVSVSAAWNIVNSVSDWKFEEKSGIPSVVGAIDCTHIRIKAPKDNKEIYFDRKHTFSVVLQAVVDADKKFTDVTCGEPGSLHDSRVLRRSNLFAKAQSDPQHLFGNNNFILGDSAYPSTSWLVPPFKDYGNLTTRQRNFNKIHSSTRIVVENAFGLLKTRFRRLLHFAEQTNLNLVINNIVSACILHNICLKFDDSNIDILTDFENYDDVQHESVEDNSPSSGNRRHILFQYLQEQNLI